MNDVISSFQKDDVSKFKELYLHADISHKCDYSIEYDHNSIKKIICIPMKNLDLIHVAAYYDSIECFTLLKDLGKSIHLKTPANITPFQYACYGGSLKVTTFICQNTDNQTILNDFPASDSNPINLAIISNSPQILNILLTNGLTLPTIAINDPFSPFKEAVKLRSPECLSILIQYIKQKQDEKTYLNEDRKNYSLIMDSIVIKSYDYLHLLVENKIGDVSFQTDKGRFALYLAIFNKDEEAVDYLLKNGAKIDMKNEYGHSLIHMAAASDNMNIVNMIFEKGCENN